MTWHIGTRGLARPVRSTGLISVTVALVITATSLATAQVSPDSLTPSARAAAGTPVLKPALATPGQATTATGTGTGTGTGKLPTRIKRPVVL